VVLAGERFALPEAAGAALAGVPTGRDLVLGVRPEGVRLSREAGEGMLPMEAHLIEPLGAYDIVDLKLGDRYLKARTASGFVDAPGNTVWAGLDPGQVHFFDAASGESLKVRL
jgi:multiple sugar transport system ATP-binding protein